METTKNKTIRNLTVLGVITSLLFVSAPVKAQDEFQEPAQDVVVEPTVEEEQIPTEDPVANEDAVPSEVVETQEQEEKTPVSRLKGELPTRIRKVTLVAAEDTIAEILQSVSKQAGFGIVMDPSSASLQKKMTIQLKKKPFDEVLEIVLESGNLEATLKGDILFVTGSKTPIEDDSGEEVLLEAGTDSDGAFIHVTRKNSKKKHKWNSDKHHNNNRVQIGKSVHIKKGEVVDDAVAVGGSLTVEGEVRGDAVAVGGNLNVEPSARIRGDAVSVGGSLDIKPGGVVEGEQVSVGIPLPLGTLFDEDGELNIVLPLALSGLAGGAATFSLLGVLLRSVMLFVFALAITALAPKRVEAIVTYFTKRTGYSFLAALVMFIAFLPLLIVLVITIIGILLVPVAFILYMLLLAFGLASLLTWIGHKIPLFQSKKNQLIALAMGAVVFFLISLIPVVGPMVLLVISFGFAGAALLTRLGSPNHTA